MSSQIPSTLSVVATFVHAPATGAQCATEYTSLVALLILDTSLRQLVPKTLNTS